MILLDHETLVAYLHAARQHNEQLLCGLETNQPKAGYI
jgi:hypothetical protein